MIDTITRRLLWVALALTLAVAVTGCHQDRCPEPTTIGTGEAIGWRTVSVDECDKPCTREFEFAREVQFIVSGNGGPTTAVIQVWGVSPIGTEYVLMTVVNPNKAQCWRIARAPRYRVRVDALASGRIRWEWVEAWHKEKR